jgi:hypothetical protein
METTEQGIKDVADFVRYTKRTSVCPQAAPGASSVPPRMKRVASETRIVRRESLGEATDVESPETSDPENEEAVRATGTAGPTEDKGSEKRDSCSLPSGALTAANALPPPVGGKSGRITPGATGTLAASSSQSDPHKTRTVETPTLRSYASPPPLVTPVLTPRFVPSCTPEMLQALGELSRVQNLPVQSHLSESQREIAWVRELHPECEHYTDVYRTFGLLHERAYFAHCCHCGADEQAILKANDVGVAHCPSSNFMLGSGVLNVRRLLDRGIKVGLGTDVAGGYSTSVLDAARQAIIASRCISFTEKDEQGQPYEALTIDEVFFLATQGGANVLGIGAAVGNFSPGKYLDAVVVDPKTEDGPLDMFDGEYLHSAFEKFLFLGDDRNIEQVYVGGKRVL